MQSISIENDHPLISAQSNNFLSLWWRAVVQIGSTTARTDMVWKKLFTGVFWNVCRVKTKYRELTADCITRWSYRFEDREVDNLCCLVGRLQTPFSSYIIYINILYIILKARMRFIVIINWTGFSVSHIYSHSWMLRDLFVLHLYLACTFARFPLVLRISWRFHNARQVDLKWSKTTRHIYADYSFRALLWESFWSLCCFYTCCL